MAPTRMRRPALVTLTCALAALAARLETCRPEALSTGAREELAAWAERLALRLWRIAPRLREGSQSRNRDIDPTTGERP